jgi:hypothetical protein
MSSTMLELVQQVTAELNLAVPTYVAGNTNQDVQQILALMNRAGYDLVKEHNWQALELEYRFYTTAITTTCDTINNTYDLLNVGNTTGLDNTYSIVGTAIPQDTYVEDSNWVNRKNKSISFCYKLLAVRLLSVKRSTRYRLTMKP